MACCGHTPFPMMRSASLRLTPGTSVTQPAGQPIIHSGNAGESRGLPLLFGSVGAGAGRVTDSHRRIAGSYFPHCCPIRITRVSTSSIRSARESGLAPPSPSDLRGVGSSSRTVPGSVD